MQPRGSRACVPTLPPLSNDVPDERPQTRATAAPTQPERGSGVLAQPAPHAPPALERRAVPRRDAQRQRRAARRAKHDRRGRIKPKAPLLAKRRRQGARRLPAKAHGRAKTSAAAPRRPSQDRAARQRPAGENGSASGRQPRVAKASRARSLPVDESVPRQGFESEGTAPRAPCQPPGRHRAGRHRRGDRRRARKGGLSTRRAPAQGRLSRLCLAPSPRLSDHRRREYVYCRPRRAAVAQVTADGGPNADRSLIRRGESVQLGP